MKRYLSLEKVRTMKKSHPFSKNLSNSFKILAPIRIWRCCQNQFYLCTESKYLDQFEKLSGFDLDEFIKILANKYNGVLPDGYYYADHQGKIGGYLNTDNYDEMISALRSKNLIV